MGDLPCTPKASWYEAAGVTSSTDYGIAVQGSTTANIKGSWATLISSTSVRARGFLLTISSISSSSANPCTAAMDIGFGTTVQIPDLYVGYSGATRKPGYMIFVPYPVPQGTQLQARVQASVGSLGRPSFYVSATLIECTERYAFNLPRATTYGMTVGLGTTSATAIDPGGTADTKGSWVQIDAATADPIRWLVGAFSCENTTLSAAKWRVDVGVGGSGSEVVRIPDLVFGGSATTDEMGPVAISVPCAVEEGSRLAVRAQCDITDATDRVFNCGFVGFS